MSTYQNAVSETRVELELAALERSKVAVFMFQVIKHADALNGVSAGEFCEAVGLEGLPGYEIDYAKALKLARFIKQQGYCLAKDTVK